ncbi:hypothetical protein J2X11_001664 [Aeromicrobium panaciterrae]|uniref:Uncharacterized protein n=1 Tax=Aeromicrobium panaciterrae TaxID=363861 RepID=A0ABU1UNW4_9ACTN|nr:hypothetical protein [Aeromicrobium panaciterrae]MDR7086825.1 hypothetical protein [Aeromicrobium panaciterrae]
MAVESIGVDGVLFEDAWAQFAAECEATVAPEATYQAWLAHFAIQKLGLLRVVREVDFGARYLGAEAATHFPGNNLMVDLLILREPAFPRDLVVDLPRRSWLGPRKPIDELPNPRSGLERLRDFSVITELKVSATQGGGLDQGEVLRDFRKLSAILSTASRHYQDAPLPDAFVGVFDNHPTRRFDFELLKHRIAEADIRPDVHLLAFPVPAVT